MRPIVALATAAMLASASAAAFAQDLLVSTQPQGDEICVGPPGNETCILLPDLPDIPDVPDVPDLGNGTGGPNGTGGEPSGNSTGGEPGGNSTGGEPGAGGSGGQGNQTGGPSGNSTGGPDPEPEPEPEPNHQQSCPYVPEQEGCGYDMQDEGSVALHFGRGYGFSIYDQTESVTIRVETSGIFGLDAAYASYGSVVEVYDAEGDLFAAKEDWDVHLRDGHFVFELEISGADLASGDWWLDFQTCYMLGDYLVSIVIDCDEDE